MQVARMYGYRQPLVIEEAKIPEIQADEVLLKVGAAGMCRTDVQLVDGYFQSALALEFPATPGHEISGWIEKAGKSVPKAAFQEGDLVVVHGGWGEGMCRQCQAGEQQICAHGRWPGFGPNGGYQEYLPVPYQHLIRVDSKVDLKPEFLAPMTDAGVTPYRGIKKLRQAGVLGPGRVIAVVGVGGLGAYAVQYAKLLSGGATVVALARSVEKLAVAKQNGADGVINIRDKSIEDVRKDLVTLTSRNEIDAAIDCVGAEETIRLGFGLLATQGAFVSVGLVGTQISIPLFPFVAREYSYHGSFWGNFNDLREVVDLVQAGKVKHTIEKVRLKDVNEALNRLRDGEVIGRAVVVFD